jgi:TonB family protein
MKINEVLPMGRLLTAAIAFAWLSAQPLAPCAAEAIEESHFQPPEAVSVSDVTNPFRSIANGTVVLDVMISEEGDVKNVQVRRELASVTEEAVRSVRTWKFEPARSNGKAVTSRMTVAVTFNPPTVLTANVPLPPLIHQGDEARIQSSFQPPQVTRATFPMCPQNALNPGTVILQTSINEAGKAQRTQVLRAAPPFTTLAIQAIEDWRFAPATLNGRPVESKVVLVFCFRQPISSWP